jgi:hypothetical protein
MEENILKKKEDKQVKRIYLKSVFDSLGNMKDLEREGNLIVFKAKLSKWKWQLRNMWIKFKYS